MTQIHGVVLDIDGTLVDSNDAHAQAWMNAMKEQGHQVSFAKIRPLIGMGGDKVLPEVLHIEKDSPEGKQISQRRIELFKEHGLPTVKAFPDTLELLQCMHEQGLKLTIATSAEPDELSSLLQKIGPHAEDLFEQETSAKDTTKSKPDADTMQIALQRIGYRPDEVLMIGDTAFDIESASKVGIRTIALRSGGWSDQDLAEALAIYDNSRDLLLHYDESPLVRGIR